MADIADIIAWLQREQEFETSPRGLDYTDAEIAAAFAQAWAEGHKLRWRRGPDNCHCYAYSSGECACGEYGNGPLLSLDENPYNITLA